MGSAGGKRIARRFKASLARRVNRRRDASFLREVSHFVHKPDASVSRQSQ
jgi:hypothetical protein